MAYNCLLVSDQGLWFPVEMKGIEASHLCQRVVSSTLPGCSWAPLDPVVTCPTSGMPILAALNCKTHNPLLTSALSSLLAIMIMWILIDQGDYYHSLNILLYCPACDWLNLENCKQVITKESCILLLLSASLFLIFPWDLRSPYTMYIQSILAEECVAILKHPIKISKSIQNRLK